MSEGVLLMPSLLESIKKAAVDAVDASNPTAVLIGTIKSLDPVTMDIEQRLSLGPMQIIITKKISDLVVGDIVVILRVQGGQKYVIIDKVVNL